jgi:hypothetical protein
VAAAREDQLPEAAEALEDLCANYWPPLYQFIRRRGYAPHDAEAFSLPGDPGHNAAIVDSLIEWTREENLYLVLTIGNASQNGNFNYDYAVGFWNFYAPCYKDEPHVIFEIQNEPHQWTPPYPSDVLDMERDVYTVIRGHAPDTPILLFTYANFNNGAGALQDIAALAPTVDWSNTAVASSIRRRLGLDTTLPKASDPASVASAEMMTDARAEWEHPLSEDMLFGWHRSLLSHDRRMLTGAWRFHPEPMQVVSGAVDQPLVCYEAPPSDQVPKKMDRYISWFNEAAKSIHHAPVRSEIAQKKPPPRRLGVPSCSACRTPLRKTSTPTTRH